MINKLYTYYSNIYIYFLKRKFTENVLQNTLNCTIDKNSGEYMLLTPKYSVRSNTLSNIFIYKMNIFTKFQQNIL